MMRDLSAVLGMLAGTRSKMAKSRYSQAMARRALHQEVGLYSFLGGYWWFCNSRCRFRYRVQEESIEKVTRGFAERKCCQDF